MRLARLRVLLMVLLLAGTVGCDRSLPTPTPTPVASAVPAAVLAARDVVLAHIADGHPEAAPTSGLVWQSRNLTPSSMIGVSYYELIAGQWQMMVNVPVVAADRYVFEVELRNEEQGITWSGKLDANLSITESNLNVAPAARTARDAVLAHVRERAPEQSPSDSLVWLGERTTPAGSKDEYCSFVSSEWALYLTFANSQPDQTVYLAELYKGDSSLIWRGQVEPDGSVMEILR
jgi:hypothetical protein